MSKYYKVTTKRTIEQVSIVYVDDELCEEAAMDRAQSWIEDDTDWKIIKDEIHFDDMKCVELKEVSDA